MHPPWLLRCRRRFPDRANYSLLGPNLQPEKLAERRFGKAIDRLKEYYTCFEKDYFVPGRFQTRANHELSVSGLDPLRSLRTLG